MSDLQFKDYYKTLGVTRSATADEIKKAYRKLARQFHPDKNKAKNAEDKFKEVNEANEVLSDPEKRKAYDSLGADWKQGSRFAPPPGWDHRYRTGGGMPGRGMPSGFGADGGGGGGPGGFSDFFSTLFGSAAGGMPQGGFGGFEDDGESFPHRSAPARARIELAIEDSYNGGSRQISLGDGRTLSVRVPKGITSGQTIRLAEQGPRGGDLLLEVEFAPHPVFKIDGRDIKVEVSVAPWQAALGGKIPVPTPGGEVELNLPAGSQAGKKLRLKGRGLPGTPPGDQTVTIRIVVPPAASDDDRAAYEAFKSHFAAFDPRVA